MLFEITQFPRAAAEVKVALLHFAACPMTELDVGSTQSKALAHSLLAMALTTRDRSQATVALSSAPGVPTGDVPIPQGTRGYPESPELIFAHRQLECALVLDPDNIDARLARADLRRATGNTAGALRDLKAASTQEPALLETHIMRAVVFINYMHDFDSGKSAAIEAHVPYRVPEFFDMSSARRGACMIGGCTSM